MASIFPSLDTAKVDEISHTIDRDGEVIIVLQNANAPFAVWPRATAAQTTATKQSTENEDIRYRVSAKHLTLTSTVFAKALSPKWNEGSALRYQGSVEVIADGWDSEALLILLNIFHCRFNHLPRQISLELLAKVAVLADYYQCIPAINIFADMWIAAIEHNLPRAYCRDLLLWLLICSLLDRSSACKELRQMAVTQSKDPIPTLGLPFPADLNRKREKLIGHILDALQTKVDHMSRHNDDGNTSNSRPCYACTTSKLGALLKLMVTLSLSPKPLWPYYGLNSEGLVESISHSRECQRNCYNCPTFREFLATFRENLQSELDDIVEAET